MNRPDSSFAAFIAELKRRRVFRVAAAYVIVAFALLQAADIIFPALGLPPWTMTAAVVFTFLGFPLAVVLAWAFDVTADGVVRTDPAAGSPLLARSHVRWGLAVLVLLVLSGTSLLSWTRWSQSGGSELDADVVAVLPFRVAGAEPSLAYLKEGMLDLLSAKLSSETGPHTVDPHTMTSAWRRAAGAEGADLSRQQALQLARRLGAGRLVLGEVVSMPGRIVLTASLNDVATSRADAPVSVEGPLDSLPSLVDRLVAGLLSVGAGEKDRLAALTTTSLPALRAYLEAQAAYRNGRYDEAFQRFKGAVTIDSTFALAAIYTWRSSLWWLDGDASDHGQRSLALAWRHRERLSERDRAYVIALVGPHYPAPTPSIELAASRQALTADRPDSPDAWFERGDVVLHWGGWLGLSDTTALRQSEDAFRRSVALDSAYLPSLGHLFDIAMMRGDAAAAQRYAALYQARDSAGLVTRAIRNAQAAHARGLSALPEITARTDSGSTVLVRYTLAYLSFHPSTMPVASAFVDHTMRQPDRMKNRDVAVVIAGFLLNRGRPAQAETLLEQMLRERQLDTLTYLTTLVRNGLYFDGDAQSGARAATTLSARLARDPATAGAPGVHARCALGQWRLAQGDRNGVEPLTAALRTAAAGDDAASHGALLCAELLDAWRAQLDGASDAAARIARLDTVAMTLFDGTRITFEANLVLARLLEQRGDAAGAFRALGRSPAFVTAVEPYRATYLRERGRLALLIGDTAAAAQAYRTFVALRHDPEPALRPEADRIRRMLEDIARPARVSAP